MDERRLDPLLGDTRRLSEQGELLEYLHERHLTLQRVEAGGWWRLRDRVLPALRAQRRLRETWGRQR